ncbi:CARDB domain-containing protein [Halobacterium hubeiense]|uniref:CARDB domain-containing protein n=2 Tax=Halobacterium hubeiense TaxID=1407499 RepID=UPI000B7DB4D5|nr:CARDB domain-containing protein [Halobacterium hubeiense]
MMLDLSIPPSRNAYSVIVVALLCTSLAIGTGAAAGSSDLFVTISDTTISDDEPETGDTITITPTIHHSSASEGGFRITEVVVTASTGETLSSVDNLGTIGADESIDVPLRATFDTAGEKHLTITVRGVQTNSSGAVEVIDTIDYPVYVSVSEPTSDDPEPAPQLDIDADTAVANTAVPVNVTVSNGRESDLSDLSVRLNAVNQSLDTETQLKPTLAAGNLTTFSFEIQPAAAGNLTLRAVLDAEEETVETTRSIPVRELRSEIAVDATVLTQNDSRYLQYRVTNLGNAPAHDVTIVGQAGETQLPAAGIGTVAPATSQTALIPADVPPNTSVTLQSSYTVGTETNQHSRTIDSVSAVNAQTADDGGVQAAQQFPLIGGLAGGFPGSLVGFVLFSACVGVGWVGYRRFRTAD